MIQICLGNTEDKPVLVDPKFDLHGPKANTAHSSPMNLCGQWQCRFHYTAVKIRGQSVMWSCTFNVTQRKQSPAFPFFWHCMLDTPRLWTARALSARHSIPHKKLAGTELSTEKTVERWTAISFRDNSTCKFITRQLVQKWLEANYALDIRKRDTKWQNWFSRCKWEYVGRDNTDKRLEIPVHYLHSQVDLEVVIRSATPLGRPATESPPQKWFNREH